MTPNIGSLARRILVIGLLVAACGVQAGPAVQGWVRRYNGPDEEDDYPAAIAVGPNGNVYVTGCSYPVHQDFTTVAYTSSGEALWTNHYGGAGSWSASSALTVGENGTVYVTGASLAANGSQGIGTVAYTSAGAPLWTNWFAGSIGAYPAAAFPVGVVANGDRVYVAGHLFNNGYGLAQPVALAYRSDGRPLWTNRYNATPGSTDQTYGLAVDDQGTVYVAGACNALWSNADWFTLAYASEGTPLWTNRYNGPGDGSDVAVTVAVQGRMVCVAGYSEGLGTGRDFTAIAYSTDGTGVWTNRYDGPAHRSDWLDAMALDRDGNVFVVGLSYVDTIAIGYSRGGMPLWTNTLPNLDVGGLGVDSNGNLIVAGSSAGWNPAGSYVTVAYSVSGTPLWTNHYEGASHGGQYTQAPYCLAFGGGGAVYVTGASQGSHNGATNYDFATVKYLPAPDIMLGVVNRFSDGKCRFIITAPVDTPYRLEASADLADWQILSNFPPLSMPSITYTDSLAPGFAQRFYRAVWSP